MKDGFIGEEIFLTHFMMGNFAYKYTVNTV